MKGQLMNPDESIQDKEKTTPLSESHSANGQQPQIKSVAEIEAPTPQQEPKLPWRKRVVSWLLLVVCGAVSGLLLGAGHFPLAQGWVAWFALVPLLFLVRTQASRDLVFFCAWLCGLLYYFPSLSWLPLASDVNFYLWLMLAFYCSLYTILGVWFLRVLDRRLQVPLTLSVPVVWVSLEYVRSFFLTGFAWYFLGHTQHDYLPLIQIADFGGVYAVTFLLALVNGLCAEWLYAIPQVRSLFRLREPRENERGKLIFARQMQTGIAFLLLVLTFAYGMWRLEQSDFERGPSVALIQGNVRQELRNDASSDDGNAAAKAKYEIWHGYTELSLRAVGLDPGAPKRTLVSTATPPDLVIWPETSFPEYWLDYTMPDDHVQNPPENQLPKDWLGYKNWVEKTWILPLVLQGTQTNMLLGINSEIWTLPADKPVMYNSALLVGKDGTFGPRYDKIHRVPFGEYMPMKDLALMKSLNPYSFEYGVAEGKKLTRFPLQKYHFGVLICNEDTDPFLARQYGVEHSDGPPVDFLVNISNDGWFDGSSEHNEHLAISRFRAIEARKALVRSVNMGISAVVDSNGKVLQPQLVKTEDGVPRWEVPGDPARASSLPLSEWNDYKKTPGILISAVPIDSRLSLYARWGDWFATLCWAGLFTAIAWCIYQGRKRRKPVAV
jgi:apolipoprotein N-acyltransferase